MPQTEGKAQSLLLMESLCRLVDGNHVRAGELAAKELRQDRDPIDAWVAWRFGHDVQSRSVHGNGAVDDAHFGFDMAGFQAHLDALGRDAAGNRDIRAPFMQTVTVAGASSLKHSDDAQRVKDYGACSVHRHCSGCGGTEQVACPRCHGAGKRSCGSCGGSGHRTVSVQRMRWNGRQNESYYASEIQNCHSCYGSGRQVCGSCGGSGRQRCEQCSGHGYFTDIVETQALARPQWRVVADRGLAHELLQHFMNECGAADALQLVPSLILLDTRYDDEDRWVAHYRGEAEVIEQDIALRDRTWTVPAVGPKPTPMQRPPLFDFLLAAEIARVRTLRGKRVQVHVSARIARQLFRDCRAVPALDRAVQEVAALAGTKSAGVDAVSETMQGFISRDAAADLAGAIEGILHKVSPPYSVLAWILVMTIPIGWVLMSTAMHVIHFTGWFDGLLGLVGVLLAGCLGVLLMSPLAWLLSTVISSLRRLRVPKPYRQKGRNWTPLRPALQAVLLAALPGLLYGLAVKNMGAPPVDPVVHFVSAWARSHAIPSPSVQAPATEPPADLAATYRAIQHYLNGHGYPVGPEDGQPGPRTRTQISRYLHDHHLSSALPPKSILTDMSR